MPHHHHEPPPHERHHHGPHHHEPGPPPPKPHWARMEQMSDEDVLRYAPPEIRRLWRKLEAVELGLAELQRQNGLILSALERIEGKSQRA